MAMRVNHGVEPIKSPSGTDRDGSRPKPPKAVALRASLEASRSVPDHQKAKRRLTVKTVAFPRSSRSGCRSRRRSGSLPFLPPPGISRTAHDEPFRSCRHNSSALGSRAPCSSVEVPGQIAPLAARAQHIHHAVYHLPHHHSASPPTMLGRWDQRFNQRPLLLGQVGPIAQLVTVVARAVLGRPHRAPPAKQVPDTESNLIRAAQPQSSNRFK